jgi:hypothetical protein
MISYNINYSIRKIQLRFAIQPKKTEHSIMVVRTGMITNQPRLPRCEYDTGTEYDIFTKFKVRLL